MAGSMRDVNGTQLYVDVSGNPEGEPIVCLHSLFLDGRMFGGFAAAAADRFRVVCPDFRAQGRSSPATTDLVEVDTCAADIAALIGDLDLGKVHLLVQSMGGDVGIRLAHDRPDQIRSIAMLGSSARSEPPEQLNEFRAWVGKVAETGFTGEELQQTIEIMLGKTVRSDPARYDIVQLWRERLEALTSNLAPAMAGVVERGSVVDFLPTIDVPVLVISGDEDIARPPAWAQEVVDGLPQAELWSLEKVGHSPILERPDIVLPRLLSFFEQVG